MSSKVNRIAKKLPRKLTEIKAKKLMENYLPEWTPRKFRATSEVKQ